MFAPFAPVKGNLNEHARADLKLRGAGEESLMGRPFTAS
jgi:hypothetical protein